MAQLPQHLSTSINSGNSFTQQIFVIKAVGATKSDEINAWSLIADAYRCLKNKINVWYRMHPVKQ